MSADNPLTRKLESLMPLSATERAALDRLTRGSQLRFAPRRDVAREGDPPGLVWLVLEGWAARYKTLPDGRRQIVGFLLPGDLCEPDGVELGRLDHSIAAISSLRCAALAPLQLEPLMRSQKLRRALAWDQMTASALQREWILSLGQRTALERIANLICELYFRLDRAGLAPGGACLFPITQRDMADATGLSTVHVNRVLKSLRQQRLVDWQGRQLRIPNLGGLMTAALFSAGWLHPGWEASMPVPAAMPL